MYLCVNECTLSDWPSSSLTCENRLCAATIFLPRFSASATEKHVKNNEMIQQRDAATANTFLFRLHYY